MNKYALVTGASGGIGLEIAVLLAENSYNLVLVARNEARLNSLKNQLQHSRSIDIIVIAKDLSLPDAGEELFNEIEKKNIAVSILINNAGFGDFGYFYKGDWKKGARMLQLNMIALTQLTRLFLPAMVKNRYGKVLNVASVAAFMPGPFMALYYATKAYVLSFSEGIAGELIGTGVTVTALCPGPTKTGFEDAADLGESKLFKTMPVATAAEVAAYGYKAMMKGKKTAIPGRVNKVSVFFLKVSPRWITSAVIKKIQGA